jgi:hypothetical protein
LKLPTLVKFDKESIERAQMKALERAKHNAIKHVPVRKRCCYTRWKKIERVKFLALLKMMGEPDYDILQQHFPDKSRQHLKNFYANRNKLGHQNIMEDLPPLESTV